MLELFTNARQGWQEYVSSGKYVALLLLVLLFLWFRREQEKERVLLIYATVVTVMCIAPVSAAFLMAYQTRFYDYQWIWSYVPVTLMIAYGTTIFLTKYWEQYQGRLWKSVGISTAVLALLLLCGSVVQKAADGEDDYPVNGEVQSVLAYLTDESQEQSICLWAPKEIMAAARAYDGTIALIYGRNMWDAALGSYSYETYSKTQEMLYLWMCHAEETGEWKYADRLMEGTDCIEAAVAAGVNRILLPGNVEAQEVEKLTETMNIRYEKLGAYYLLVPEGKSSFGK